MPAMQTSQSAKEPSFQHSKTMASCEASSSMFRTPYNAFSTPLIHTNLQSQLNAAESSQLLHDPRRQVSMHTTSPLQDCTGNFLNTSASFQTNWHALTSSQPRPSTAPGGLHDDLENIMPAKRTLPFDAGQPSSTHTMRNVSEAARKVQQTPRATGNTKVANNGQTKVRKVLQDYASKGQAERAKEMDQLILSCIDSDEFVILCEDLEQAWRRIGLERLGELS